MRVQSNGLPNHCFYSPANNPVEADTDWTVKFNPDMTGVKHYADYAKSEIYSCNDMLGVA